MFKKSLCCLVAAISPICVASAHADEYNYDIYVPAITNMYANDTWHGFHNWYNEGGNPIEIPVTAGGSVSLKAAGIIDYSAVRAPGDSAYGPDGWDYDFRTSNGLNLYGLAGIWVSQIDRSQSPYWGLTPIGEAFDVGSDFSGTAPPGAVALMLGVIDPAYVVGQDDIDGADYYDQDDLGKLDGDGQYTVQVTSTAPRSSYNDPQILPQINVEASALSGSAPLTVTFDASGSTDDGDIVRYKWNFGNKLFVGESRETHTFTSPGQHQIEATVVDNQSFASTVTLTVNVVQAGQNLPPEASFAVTTDGVTAQVDASGSVDRDGVISEYRWGFGDGNSATGVTASHTYSEAGDYTITLTVMDNVGTESEAERSVSLSGEGITDEVDNPQPSVDSSPDSDQTVEEEQPDSSNEGSSVIPATDSTTAGTSSGGGGALGLSLLALFGVRRLRYRGMTL